MAFPDSIFKASSKKRSDWLNPERSAGVELATMNKDKKCWEAVGEAREAFNSLQQEIDDYVSQTCESQHQPVTWSLYMVGRTKETSRPAITFISGAPGPRKRVRTLVKSSGLLEKHPGFVTMDMDRPPPCISGDIKPLANVGGLSSGDIAILPPSQPPSQPPSFMHSAAEPDLTQKPTLASSHILVGANIYRQGQNHSLVATAGGLVQRNGKVYLTSVLHAFEPAFPNLFPKTDELACSFDIDDFTDEEDAEGALAQSTSRGSVTPGSGRSDTSDCSRNFEVCSSSSSPPLGPGHDDMERNSVEDPLARLAKLSEQLKSLHDIGEENKPRPQVAGNLIADSEASLRRRSEKTEPIPPVSRLPSISVGVAEPKLALGEPKLTSADGSKPTLDYALFEILAPISEIKRNFSLILSRNYTLAREPTSTDVEAHAPSGTLRGRLLATASFIQSPGLRSQQLWTVIFKGNVGEGSCGSWVYDPISSKVFGYIVSGSPEDGFTYIVPLYQMIDDLCSRCGGGWTLYDSNKNSMSDILPARSAFLDAWMNPDAPMKRLNDILGPEEHRSVSTGLSKALPRNHVLEPNDAGTLECPIVFECPFWFLDCNEVFGDEEQWRDHTLSHFKGKSPPRTVHCPLCDDFKQQTDDGRLSWTLKMDHLADHHRQGHTLRDGRAEYHLIDYLWKIKVINDNKLKELKSNFDVNQPARLDTDPATRSSSSRTKLSYAHTYWNNR